MTAHDSIVACNCLRYLPNVETHLPIPRRRLNHSFTLAKAHSFKNSDIFGILNSCCAQVKGFLSAHTKYSLLQESGLARILMPELGLETVMRINRPAKPGDELDICVGFIDVPKGIYKFSEAAFGQTVNSQDVNSQNELDSDEDGEAVGEADDAVSEPADPAEADTAVVTS